MTYLAFSSDLSARIAQVERVGLRYGKKAKPVHFPGAVRMSHLYLPAEHTHTDLALASAVAEAISSNELFVAWTCDGGAVAAPEVKATVRDAEPALRNPFAEALIEIVAAFHALVNMIFFRRPSRAADAAPAIRASRSELEGAA